MAASSDGTRRKSSGRRRACTGLAVVALVACQSSPGPVASELVTMPAAPRGQCQNLGELLGESAGGGNRNNAELATAAERDLQHKAEERGATHLQLMPAQLAAGKAEVKGIAFRCVGEVSYGTASLLGATDPRLAKVEARGPDPVIASANAPKVPRKPTLGVSTDKAGCLPGNVYPLAAAGVLPKDYETAPSAELWGCDWNIASAAGQPAFPNAQPGQAYAVRHQGAFTAPSVGIYIFAINGDQPFRLTVGGNVVVEGTGTQTAQVELKAGEHPIKLEYLYTGGQRFDFGVNVQPPGGAMQPFSVAQGSPFYAAQGLRYAGAERLGEGWRQLVDVQKGEINITKQVHFETNRSDIRKDDDSEAVLFAVAKALRENATVERLEVQGYTDDQGNPAYNIELSQRRAESVRNWLIDAGIAPHRLVAKGYGQGQALDAKHAEGSRAENRRVQFVVLQTQPTATAAARP